MGNNGVILFGNIVVTNGYICVRKFNVDGTYYDDEKARYVGIDEIIKNIDTNKTFVNITFDDCFGTHTIRVSKAEISNKLKLLGLSSYGVEVYDHNVSYIQKNLANEEAGAQIAYEHSNLGFKVINGNMFFEHYTIIGEKADIDSKYVGGFDINPKGSRDVWLKMVLDLIIGHIPLEAALTAGLSAVVFGFIGDKINMECPIYHFYGDSSTGKTTAAMLAVSPFGAPTAKGLLRNWNTTANALIGSLAGVSGIPIFFDEASMSAIKDFTATLFTIASGQEKGRSTKEGENRPVKSWQTVVGSTGEFSLLSNSREVTGLLARVSEFDCIWTESAEIADSIKTCVSQNYGHFGVEFAKILLELGSDKVIKMYNHCKKQVIKKLGNDGIKSRLAGKIALLVTTAYIVNKNTEIKIDYNKLMTFLIENETAKLEEGTLAERALEAFKQSIVLNNKKFDRRYKWTGGLFLPAHNEFWGKMEEFNDHVEVTILTSVFKNLLYSLGFPDPKVILKAWKQMELLNTEDGKCGNRRAFKGVEEAVYIIYLDNTDIGTSDDESDTEFPEIDQEENDNRESASE